MLQPFYAFSPKYISRFKELNKRYFVSQRYPRGNSVASKLNKTSILLSDYDNPGLAKNHLAAIKHDPLASIIDLDNEKHLAKLKEILGSQSKYLVFWAAVKNASTLNAQIRRQLKPNVKRYLAAHTKWHIGRDEIVDIKLELEFGTFFMNISRGPQTLRVPLEKIEKA